MKKGIKRAVGFVLSLALAVTIILPLGVNASDVTAVDKEEGNEASVSMYRMYNPNSGEHFYTGSVAEKDNLVSAGWGFEGIEWVAPLSSAEPVYRLYSQSTGDHHYTSSAAEKEYLESIGWNYEEIGWYSADRTGTPVYRLFNPNATGAGSHNYTSNVAEKDNLILAGWKDEGIGWYGTPAEYVMSYKEYIAAPLNTEVTVETYIQGADDWKGGRITLYTQDQDGGYFIYDMPCEREESTKLVPGTKIKVTGTKSAWNGEVEIINASYEIEEGYYIAEAKDVTDLLGTDELIDYMNQYVSFKGLRVEPSKDKDGNEAPFLYKWDGTGQEGDDVYFNVSKNGQTYTFLVRSILTGPETDEYKAAKELNIGDTIDCEGFLYWYNGVNPHITEIVEVK